MAFALLAAMAIWESSRGYIASMSGSGQLTHATGTTVPLKAESLKSCVRLFTGDRVLLANSTSKAMLILDGRRVRMVGASVFTVPSDAAQVGELASRTVLAGRGAGSGVKPAPFEKLAIFCRQDGEESPAGNLTVFNDGSLPIVWAHDELAKSVQITIQVDDEPSFTTESIPAHANGISSYPFGSTNRKDLGDYLLKNLSDKFARQVTLTIKDNNGRTNKSYWTIQKKAEFERARKLFKANAVDDFDLFDSTVQSAEGGEGGSKSPSYPGIKTALVYGYFAKHADAFIALEMLHFLSLTHQFPGIELQLKKQLDARDKG